MRGAVLFGILLSCAGIVGTAQAQSASSDPSYQPALAASSFNEIRLGGSGFVDSNARVREHDVFIDGEVLLASPFPTLSNPWVDALLRPRPTVGTTIATAGGTSEVHAGLTWDFPLIGNLFLDASLGGAWHDGRLTYSPDGRGPLLGSRFLFRESIGLGYSFNAHWNVIVAIDHASNADLAKPNDGLTHVGATVGYRF